MSKSGSKGNRANNRHVCCLSIYCWSSIEPQEPSFVIITSLSLSPSSFKFLSHEDQRLLNTIHLLAKRRQRNCTSCKGSQVWGRAVVRSVVLVSNERMRCTSCRCMNREDLLYALCIYLCTYSRTVPFAHSNPRSSSLCHGFAPMPLSRSVAQEMQLNFNFSPSESPLPKQEKRTGCILCASVQLLSQWLVDFEDRVPHKEFHMLEFEMTCKWIPVPCFLRTFSSTTHSVYSRVNNMRVSSLKSVIAWEYT